MRNGRVTRQGMSPAENRWTLALRAVAAMGLGSGWLMTSSLGAILALRLFSLYCLLDGALLIALGSRGDGRVNFRAHWPAPLISGTLEATIGLVSFAWPATSVPATILLLSIWLVSRGILDCAAAVENRLALAEGQVIYMNSAGILSILVGATVIAWPLVGSISIASCIGAYSLGYGILTAFSALTQLSLLRPRRPSSLGDRGTRPALATNHQKGEKSGKSAA